MSYFLPIKGAKEGHISLKIVHKDIDLDPTTPDGCRSRARLYDLLKWNFVFHYTNEKMEVILTVKQKDWDDYNRILEGSFKRITDIIFRENNNEPANNELIESVLYRIELALDYF